MGWTSKNLTRICIPTLHFTDGLVAKCVSFTFGGVSCREVDVISQNRLEIVQ